jgi:hypothetical protein
MCFDEWATTPQNEGYEPLAKLSGAEMGSEREPEVPDKGLVRKFFRYTALYSIAFVCLAVIADHAISGWIETMDVRGVISDIDTFRVEPTCPNDGRICICSHSYHVAGPDPAYPILNQIVPDPGSTACQPWKFQVGDVIMAEKPIAGAAGQSTQADLVAKWTQSNVVHAAIISEVPPEGTPQNGGNVFLVEALKGNVKKVERNPLMQFVVRYPWGGIHIRRVDPTRFPFFATNAGQMTTWLNARVNEPFDTDMVNPMKRQFTAGDRYIPTGDPWCDTRKRAFGMYMTGGPHQWICSQLVAWALAFPGGLNTYAAYSDPMCPQPHWNVKDLQPNPGDFLKPDKADYIGPTPYYVPCDTVGCFTALSSVGNTLVTPGSENHPPLYSPGTVAPTPVVTIPPTTPATTPLTTPATPGITSAPVVATPPTTPATPVLTFALAPVVATTPTTPPIAWPR